MADSKPTLVLDAMGVLYCHPDDVAELLVPYVCIRGGCAPSDIEDAYLDASLGRLTSEQFWARVGLDGSDEDYCSLHRLATGTYELLVTARQRGMNLACLSNDVSEWSACLRRRHGLVEAGIDNWVISGDVGARKPDAAMYEQLEAGDRRRRPVHPGRRQAREPQDGSCSRVAYRSLRSAGR